MSNNPNIAIARRNDKTHIRLGVREGSVSSNIVVTCNQKRARMTLNNNACGEAVADSTAAADADANATHTSQAL